MWWDIYTKYDVTSETMMMGLSIVMLIIMLVSQPRISNMYRIIVVGLGLGIVTILTHQAMLYLTCNTENFSYPLFATLYVLYCVLYSVLLNLIFVYVSLLSYRRRKSLKSMHIVMQVLYIVFLSLMLYPLFAGKLFVISADGTFTFTKWQYCVNNAGVVDAVITWVITIRKRKEVSAIVSWGVFLFAPIEIAILALETVFDSVYFISYTYVLPFIIYFVLFHCSKYDDVVGCQNADAISTQINKAIKAGKKFVLINSQFPQLKKREFGDIKSVIDYVSSEKCRQIESLNRKIRLYSSSVYSYYLFSIVNTDEEAEKIIEGVNKILSEPMGMDKMTYKVYSKQIVLREHEELKNYKHVNSLLGYLSKKFSGSMENERIIASDKDYASSKTYYEVEQAILDIRAKNDPDDERVLCFIQPIHKIETNSFQTGEALMRMRLDGKMIFPDQFIELAENNDCIHTLTRIMVNKVCKKIRELEEADYDFEAITVNFSTLEFADLELYKEMYEIIESNHINPAHIKIEITESTSASNFDSILHNMDKLNELGVAFYLDDFGTGYSNLDRIINCPFKTIKFDKSILYNAISNEKADEMMRMMVKFFSKNELKTVIEGVEDEEQYNYCKEVGFDYVQGYLFSKPLPAEEITKFFTK